MIDQVGTDGVVDSELEGDFQLGADTVCRGDENRTGKLFEVEAKKAPKTANL